VWSDKLSIWMFILSEKEESDNQNIQSESCNLEMPPARWHTVRVRRAWFGSLIITFDFTWSLYWHDTWYLYQRHNNAHTVLRHQSSTDDWGNFDINRLFLCKTRYIYLVNKDGILIIVWMCRKRICDGIVRLGCLGLCNMIMIGLWCLPGILEEGDRGW